MKLTEITDKETFHRKLSDPAAQELSDIANELNIGGPRGFSFNAYGADKESAQIVSMPPPIGVETEVHNLVGIIKNFILQSDHWVWDTWTGDAEEELTAYVIRKT